MSDRLAAKKDLKRQRIMEAARRRFGRFGIRATTMQDIAREADIAVGTIYQFFPDKDALILAWVEEHRQLIHEQWIEVLSRPIPPDEKLREFLRIRFHTVRQVREEPAISEITRAVLRLTPQSIAEMTGIVRIQIQHILEEGLRTGILPSAEPERDAPIFFDAMNGFFCSQEDPIVGPPDETAMLRVVDWFIAKWKLPPPTSPA